MLRAPALFSPNAKEALAVHQQRKLLFTYQANCPEPVFNAGLLEMQLWTSILFSHLWESHLL